MKRLAILAVACLLLAGCSQVAAIAPVGGSHEAEVRYAAIDVLLDASTEVLVAPVCESDEAGTVTCAGETVAGDEISVVSTATDPTAVEVRVGTDVLYSGSIMEVLDRAARAGS
ncbi:hypothetical protein ACLBXX_19100 [Microbacterium sp. C23T]